MSYLDKINKSVKRFKCPPQKSVTIPHQAFTPREILKQFVVNDVQVMQRQPSDDLGDFEGDVTKASSSVMEFEDDFQARNFVRNELPALIRLRSSVDQPPKEELPKEEPSKEQPSKEESPKEEPPAE